MWLSRHTWQGALLLLWLLLVSGCGFHLRGNIALPEQLQRTYIAGVAEDSDTALAIEQVLVNQGGERVMSRAEATAVLQINGTAYNRRVLSVDAKGKASEYELTYRMDFSLSNAAGDLLVVPQQVSQQRDYVYDKGNVLGSSDEESFLRKEMLKSAVQQMIYRVRAALDSGVLPEQNAPADSEAQ